MKKSWKGAGGDGSWLGAKTKKEVSYKGEEGSGRDSDREGCLRVREGN